MPERNRLEQVGHLYRYLMENFNFSMGNGIIRLNEAAGDHASLIVACNFVDLQRYITLDHVRLGNEPPLYFLHETRKCSGVCRKDGTKSCYCNGDCFSERPCHWLRFENNRPYCFLAHPYSPQFAERELSYEEIRESILKKCADRHEKSVVMRIMPAHGQEELPI